ncbi:MAG: polysaccharide biosynthesis protein [Chromatiales bacterium]|nr:polysaccharide biosynthesis protein [Chromatiales bacterium]
MIVPAWLGAYWLRFNLGPIPDSFSSVAWGALPVVLAVQVMAFWYFGLYRGVWRFASLPDLVRIGKAVLTGVVIIGVTLFLTVRASGVPRSVLPLYALLLLVLLGGPRLFYRWLKDHKLRLSSGERVLIVGAGRAGELLVRDLVRNAHDRYQPIALIDDDRQKLGRRIHDLPIAGVTRDIPALVQKLGIQLIMIAIPSARSDQMRAIVEQCERAGVPFRTLPAVADMLSGSVGLRQLREVSIGDILGRESVRFDPGPVFAALAGKRVVVTGAAGSIGSELCRQIVAAEPELLVLVDQNENGLHAISMDLASAGFTDRCRCELVDIRDAVAIGALLYEVRPQFLFHAAAYKHVPLLEGQVLPAVGNNVLGTEVVARAALAAGVERFVLISTDKAVAPVNVMGRTKKAAELIVRALQGQSATRFVVVRFGNVLNSAGSVIPIFREQISRGGPVTVTHPDMERFFMTIPEACHLILQGATVAEGGEVFVLDMGQPIRIADLAEQMIRLSGHEPGRDVEIVYTGLRPGERLGESLFETAEQVVPSGHSKILLARPAAAPPDWVEGALAQIREAVSARDATRAVDALQRLVGPGEPDVNPARANGAPLRSAGRR